MGKKYEYIVLNPSDMSELSKEGQTRSSVLNSLGDKGFRYSHAVQSSDVFVREVEENYINPFKEYFQENILKFLNDRVLRMMNDKKDKENE